MWLGRECIVYLDYMKKQGDSIYDVYIDFRLKKDLTLFVSSSENNQNFGETNTYLELCNVKTNKRLRSGCYYKLNLALINKLQFIQNEESLFIGRTYNCETMKWPNIDQEELLQSHELLDPTELLRNNPNELIIQDLSNYFIESGVNMSEVNDELRAIVDGFNVTRSDLDNILAGIHLDKTLFAKGLVGVFKDLNIKITPSMLINILKRNFAAVFKEVLPKILSKDTIYKILDPNFDRVDFVNSLNYLKSAVTVDFDKVSNSIIKIYNKKVLTLCF